MAKLLIWALLLLFFSAGIHANPYYFLPLNVETLSPSDIFTAAETQARNIGKLLDVSFQQDSKPLQPHVLVVLNPEPTTQETPNFRAYWRGNMLPDQLAPAESGVLYLEQQTENGDWITHSLSPTPPPMAPQRWKDLSASKNEIPHANIGESMLAPIDPVLETPYQLGMLNKSPVLLLLWRSPEEGSSLLGGGILIQLQINNSTDGDVKILRDYIATHTPTHSSKAVEFFSYYQPTSAHD